ncbi:pentatricopeptide repeat-containing protein At4g21065-like [Olea europaea var. sylvestris]|uniref:Pentatricopeptide repeat-containing At4g21065-like n=1 Tax=Olea europaea subsp. europaea TaxID=158383 RepID=A0A8S0QC26_OLEEU|nr:pentatricopeptide repeat-containing protein At4g21065-like [Olea europaea var. sylvestris]CAA2963236.1 pentatricopeptide repeat-containing At4g21065-like [Olea europaea subsp. europaea]
MAIKNQTSKAKSLLPLFNKCSTMKEVKQLHANVIINGLSQNLYLLGKIIGFCAVSAHGSMDYAVKVFAKTENPDGFLWNTMIRGLVRTNQVDETFKYYKKMLENGEIADNFTFSFLLKICGQLGSVKLGKQMHCSVLKHGLENHVHVSNTLIHMYGMLRVIPIAKELFDEMPEPGIVAWNTIIDCHVYCGKYKEALELFLKMYGSGIAFDEATLVVVLSACSSLGVLGFGKWVHSLADNAGFSGLVLVCNSLIDMYAKCGAVEEAYKVFHNMLERNLVTWNTMILGLAMHGHAHEALELFSKFLYKKLEMPNDVTFLGVLCACSHAGRVEEGRRYFRCMTDEYHIQPNIKHYGCMVDILGRAGLVEEAYQLITGMPIECNAIVWRTLLAACGVHGNVELGERVRRHLLEVEPDHSSDYVLLANMHAGTGQWNYMMEGRKLMQDRGIQKQKPGNSSIGLLQD